MVVADVRNMNELGPSTSWVKQTRKRKEKNLPNARLDPEAFRQYFTEYSALSLTCSCRPQAPSSLFMSWLLLHSPIRCRLFLQNLYLFSCSTNILITHILTTEDRYTTTTGTSSTTFWPSCHKTELILFVLKADSPAAHDFFILPVTDPDS